MYEYHNSIDLGPRFYNVLEPKWHLRPSTSTSKSLVYFMSVGLSTSKRELQKLEPVEFESPNENFPAKRNEQPALFCKKLLFGKKVASFGRHRVPPSNLLFCAE